MIKMSKEYKGMQLFYDSYDSPIGTIYVAVSEEGVCRVELDEESWMAYKETQGKLLYEPDKCKAVIKQLEEYFKGIRSTFDVPIMLDGTEFQKNVWEKLQEIPYGEIRSYKQIAEAIGNPKAVRAVGGANRANPVPLLIPCHRVIGKDGSLTGYAGKKIDMKKYLLELEKGSLENK